ncbi:MAG: hypothetical protein WA821_14235 [Anaerolineales bacterium]
MSDLDALCELLKNRRALYSSHEMSEILLSAYTLLGIAFKMKAEILVVLPVQILCLDKDEKIIYPFRPEMLDVEYKNDIQRISNIDIFDLIMLRDQVVRDHLEAISKSPEKSIYKIKTNFNQAQIHD